MAKIYLKKVPEYEGCKGCFFYDTDNEKYCHKTIVKRHGGCFKKHIIYKFVRREE